MLYVLKKKKKKKKIEQCHKLLLVLGGGLVPTCSYSERWQVYSSNRAVLPWCSVRHA